MIWKAVVCGLGLVMAGTQTASAALIAVAGSTASSSRVAGGPSPVGALHDGTGLSAVGLFGTGTHGVDVTTMWRSGNTPPVVPFPHTITFDLGDSGGALGEWDITDIAYWNYNEFNLTDRGANNVDITYGATSALGTVLGSFAFGVGTGEAGLASFTGEHRGVHGTIRWIQYHVEHTG